MSTLAPERELCPRCGRVVATSADLSAQPDVNLCYRPLFGYDAQCRPGRR